MIENHLIVFYLLKEKYTEESVNKFEHDFQSEILKSFMIQHAILFA